MGNFKSHHFVSDCHSDFVEELASTLPERKLEIGGLIPRKRDVKVQMQEKDVEILSLECKDEFIPRTSLVGGKARRLMELHKMEAKIFSVPKGMVVTTLAFKKHVLDELGCTYKRANEAREKILAFEVPKAFAESIERSLDEKVSRLLPNITFDLFQSLFGQFRLFLFFRFDVKNSQSCFVFTRFFSRHGTLCGQVPLWKTERKDQWRELQKHFSSFESKTLFRRWSPFGLHCTKRELRATWRIFLKSPSWQWSSRRWSMLL